MMKKEPERYIYDEQESQRRQQGSFQKRIKAVMSICPIRSLHLLQNKLSVQAAFFVCQSVKSDIASLL
nr:hypothetical protein P5651_10255 [Bacillus subtilis]